MKIGDKVLVKGIVDEIRKDVVIVRNEGGYFGTVPGEIVGKSAEQEPSEDCDNDCEHCAYLECPIEPMTLDEAIKHAEEVAESRCDECGAEHKQLAKWLKELKAYRDKRGISIEDFEDAMDALREPCEDAVSRQAVLDIIDKWYESNRDVENIEDLIVFVTYLPSVQPTKISTRCPECGAWFGYNMRATQNEPF